MSYVQRVGDNHTLTHCAGWQLAITGRGSMHRIIAFVLICIASAQARAEPRELTDHTIVLGVGAAAEIGVHGSDASAGGNLMLEWEAIDGWLELEFGASLVATSTGSQVPLDLIIKKPFAISDSLEGMIGLGPEVIRTTSGPPADTRYGVEVGLDLMYWFSPRIGSWVEPTYDLEFHNGATSSFGLTAGIMTGW